MKDLINNNFENSLNRLNSNMSNKTYFRTNQFEIINGANISENYYGKNRRYSYFSKCHFFKCNFKEAGFASSVFSECKFTNCCFDFANFQSCDFRFCTFEFNDESKEIVATRFMKSIFFNCKIHNVYFNSANFCESIFNGDEICNTTFHSCAFEDMLLKNTLLDNIKFSSQNFDFLKFINIKTKDTVFPFPAIPCITNGLFYLMNTKDNISFTSESSKRLTKEEYLNYIPDFILFYEKSKNYYFLANIYISLKDFHKSLDAIKMGIEQSLLIHNFRMIRHYSQLLNNKFFSIQNRKEIYGMIVDGLNKIPLKECDIDNLNIYISDIKTLLLDKVDSPYLTLDIQTNINDNEYDKIILFYKYLENVIRCYIKGHENHSIEIRHNSEVHFFIELFSDPERLIIFLAAVSECCTFAYKLTNLLISKTKTIIKNYKNRKKTKQQVPFTQEQIHYIEQLINGKNQVNIENSTIQITEINHCIYNVENLNSGIQNSYFINSNHNS
jgi:uncharacterized protein YjbI with pentapeptide repeats